MLVCRTMQPVMLMFPFERPMFMREYSTGSYSAVAYFLSKAIVELPLAFLQSVVQYLLIYYLVNMQGNWIYLVTTAWGLGIASSSVAVVLGCLVTEVKDVTELAPLLFVPQMLFAGFFIRLSQVPVWLRWAQYLCAMKYAMNLILLIEFNTSLKSCQGNAHYACNAVLLDNDVVQDDWWVYALLIFVLFVGFRGIACYILAQKAKRFY
jgi:ABC-type multidrug transport system permease subunit